MSRLPSSITPRLAAVALLVIAVTGIAIAADTDGEPTVRVTTAEGVVQVEVQADFAATRGEVWEVLTDVEHFPDFIAKLTSSKVLAREGNVWRIAQSGYVGFGPFKFEMHSEREWTLTPPERIEARMISGTMKRFRSTMLLGDAEGRTRLRYSSEGVPDTVLPLWLGRSMIERETRTHFRAVRDEILRRKAAAASHSGGQTAGTGAGQ